METETYNAAATIDQVAGKAEVILLQVTTVMMLTILIAGVATTRGNRTEAGRDEETGDPALVRMEVTVTIIGVSGVRTRRELDLVGG